MKVQLRVEYTDDDVDRIIIEAHTKQFGAPPSGMEWTASEYYGRMVVEAVEIKQESVAPVAPATTETAAVDIKDVF